MERPQHYRFHQGQKALPFSADEYGDRLAKLRASMATKGIDACVLSSMPNVAYYSGFLYCAFGRPYALVVTATDDVTFSAGIDAAQLSEHLPNAKHVAFAGSWHMSGIGECAPLGRLIIWASGYFTGETNICGEAARYRTIIQEEMLEEILPFMEQNRMSAASAPTS